MSNDPPRVAFFRPDDERTDRASELLEELGAFPFPDPMLSIQPTGVSPRGDADVVILTSKTGVDIVSGEDGIFEDTTVCAIGEATANALAEANISVDVVPDEYTSEGLVDSLVDEVSGARVEVARSDHGRRALLTGLIEAGAYVHETVLYELIRPPEAGRSTDLLLAEELDAVLFTSALTVEHFLETAEERASSQAVREALSEVVVGAIGSPTAEAARSHGIPVDVIASRATFEALAREVLEELRSVEAT